MGGLVGRWNATGANPTFNGYVGQDDVEETEIDERIVTDSSITSVVSAQEFGGMIGMLKVEHKGDESGATINVKGTHFYPFTVNTIENSNYNNSSSFMDYYYEEETGKENELFLVAHSVYSNLDKFNIVSSASGEVLAQDRISEHYAYHRSYGSNPEAEEFKFIENKMVELHEKFKNGTIQDFQISYDPYDLTGYDGGTDSMLLGTDEFEALQSKKYPDDFDGMLTTSPDRFLTEKEIYAFYTGTLYSKVQDLQTISSVEGYKDMGIIFTISYSLPGEEANNFANPFRPQDSIGWHKDFMGFRKLQRSIVQDNNDFGNSTAVLFDAGNIREIQIFDNNKIAYMIYERSENDVVLYARNVVAQLVVDQNGNIKNNGEFINKGNSIYNAESSTSFNSTEGLFVPGGNVFLLEKAGSEFNGAYFIVLRYNDEENKYLKSASMFSDYYTKKPIYTADQLIDKAEKYLDKGKYDKAQKFYSEADDLINKQYTILEHGNLLSAKTYAKLEDYSSVGALGYSYTRELMYQNNKLNTSNDSMINFSQSNYYGYLYYSDIRPNDYYSNYWLEFSEDKELNSYSIYQTPEGIQLQEKYYFYHGAYYIHPYAKDIVYRQSQDFFNELNYDTSALWEFRNGYYYTYEGDLYNNMFSNNGLNTEKYTEKIEQKYVYKESFDFNNYVEKYDYIKKNLYLTLETSGVQGASHVAELERLESISDDLEENIDYIAVNQGEFINYYNLATIGNFVSDKVGYDLCEYAKGNQDAGNVIYVNVYYTINAEQAIGKDSNSILNAIFVNAELFENIQETDIVITETQNFLYFEGGYKLQDGVLKGVVYDFDDETNEYVETLYDVSSKYLISHGIKDIEDGHLTYRDYLNKTDKEGKDGYNYNKFTTNEEYNFYTRYDFGTNFTQSPFLALNPVKGFMVNKKSINHLCYYDLYCCETEEGYEFIWKNAGIAEKTGWNVKKKNELELYYEDLGETDGKAKGEFDDIITISSEKQEYYREKYKVGLEYDVKNSETIDYNGKTYRQVCGEWKVLAQSGSPNFDIKTYFVESVSVKLGGFFISING